VNDIYEASPLKIEHTELEPIDIAIYPGGIIATLLTSQLQTLIVIL
jgi:hypothetical protein